MWTQKPGKGPYQPIWSRLEDVGLVRGITGLYQPNQIAIIPEGLYTPVAFIPDWAPTGTADLICAAPDLNIALIRLVNIIHHPFITLVTCTMPSHVRKHFDDALTGAQTVLDAANWEAYEPKP